MGATRKLIQKSVLTNSASTVVFSSIPDTYTDLLVEVSIRGTVDIGSSIQYDTDFYLRPNGATTGFAGWVLTSSGASAFSVNPSTIRGVMTLPRATSNTFASNEFYIVNYAGSTEKLVSITGVNETKAVSGVYTSIVSGLWSNTAAITSLEFVPFTGSFSSGSSFYLYGITKA